MKARMGNGVQRALPVRVRYKLYRKNGNFKEIVGDFTLHRVARHHFHHAAKPT